VVENVPVSVDESAPSDIIVCKNQKITFLASTAFFIGNVHFVLRGPDNFIVRETELQEPYYMFANRKVTERVRRPYPERDVYRKVSVVRGLFLPSTGHYTLTVQSDYEPDQVTTVDFTVVRC
jgi:hypothetical protein